jgi:hypothetical protein
MQKKTLALWALLAVLASSAAATEMGTAFTYQGRLCDGGVPANGLYDFTFELYSAPDPPGDPIDSQPLPGVPVTNGLFTTNINFGISPFAAGEARWLRILACTNGADSPVPLGPRQELKPTPYALYAANAATVSTVPWGSITSVPDGLNDGDNDTTYTNGQGLTLFGTVFSVDTNFFNGRYWALGGNGGTTAGPNFVGTTDNQPLELKVKAIRALRLEPATDVLGNVHPTLNAGAPDNSIVFSHGATIGGGWSNTITNAPAAFLGGGTLNVIRNSQQGFIGSGLGNEIEASIGAAIGSGEYNHIYPGALYSVISGGNRNTAQETAQYCAIGGGYWNRIQTNASYATVAGGDENIIYPNARYAAVGGGRFNYILTSCTNATIAGGHLNRIAEESTAAAIGGGDKNTIGSYSYSSFLGGGSGNRIGDGAPFVYLGGGWANTNASRSSFLGGGGGNVIRTNTCGSVLVGGTANRIEPFLEGDFSCWGNCFLGGGYENRIEGGCLRGVIGGGAYNETHAVLAGTIAGGEANYVGTNIFTDELGAFTNTADYGFIGGGSWNWVSGTNATVAGGYYNEAYGNYSLVGGGDHNVAGGFEIRSHHACGATVAGGSYNQAAASSSVVGGGTNNFAVAEASTIPGGKDAKAVSYGQHAYASGSFANSGDAQTSMYVLRGQFFGAATNELFLDGQFARMWMPIDSTWAYDILVVARLAGTMSVAWHIRGVIENNTGATALDGIALQQKDQLNNDFTGDVFVEANDAADALVIKVTNGNAVTPVRWVATVRTAEVTFP